MLRAARRLSARQLGIAKFHDCHRYQSPGGIVRVPLNSPKVVGVAVSRGTREYQEDTSTVATIHVPPDELARSCRKNHDIHWDPSGLPSELAGQVLFSGIYDGHGGPHASAFLRDRLQGFFESVDSEQAPSLYAWLKHFGGYFRRWQGGDIAAWRHPSEHPQPLDLEARASLAFIAADKAFSEAFQESAHCGATASVALLQVLDNPTTPFFSAQRLALTVAHCGDTRVLLCATEGGQVERLTEIHHADGRGESARLRAIASWQSSDSFGESRWMGALANTRCIGDSQYKRYGVTPEPEITTHLLHGPQYAYIILISDGVSGVLSDDEVVDLARNSRDPRSAADKIVDFAEELGASDNMTVVVIPLAGWGHITGPDMTRDLREYKRKNSQGSERQRRM